MLKCWLGASIWPEYDAWILSDMAQYLAQTGDIESALSLACRAREVAQRCENPNELEHRQLDEAQLLIGAGRAREALALAERSRAGLPAETSLVETEAYLSLGEVATAHDRLHHAYQVIEARALTHLEPKTHRLMSRF
jgi:hypothetical protein